MRIALGIEYNGDKLFGWQSQQNLPTVQQYLETALSKVADEPIQLYCAGRTDAGVHALQQVAHFDTTAIRAKRAWVWGGNSYLPPEISIHWAEEVDDSFHARFSALSRRYYYLIYNHAVRSALFHQKATWIHHDLDIERMQLAANDLLGEQDFSSFRSAQCESKTPKRNIHHIYVTRNNDFILIDIQANAFLHHMVRNITGLLLRIGAGQAEVAWAKAVLEAKDRRLAAETAPASGLYLADVSYPADYSFPKAKFLL
ncbi:hypothetical protein AYO45_04365 [Gammaproteobacteria bacterium SCGC AG-212-F23]|nr:hypothetical protein AYO45_04365 [Gammaproteobacteria bacterium SCGC AG-212-F23]